MQSRSEFEARLSKSRFIAGVQCLKRPYLQVYEPELGAEPDEATDAILKRGGGDGTPPPSPGGVTRQGHVREGTTGLARALTP